ncbi:unnamed protein product [Acanthoscelides obtectus]|uniref:Peptidase S1 domain-containing protein n=1 Tax=Acanthoscelides obtectus TaxID=200917 RepID=A0A9P0PLS9_ACAOB|nr:unnamed protein product [Acanthoscelides obtectus]CAK1666440.1 Inactive serine protease scarface [Acanthoscelides obtectus]
MPVCAPGESLSPSGQCVTPTGATSRPTCGPGQVLTPSGDCVSRQTTSRPTYGPSTRKPCPPGQVPSTSGLGCEYLSGPSTARPSFRPGATKPSTYRPVPTTPFPERQQPTATSRPQCNPGESLSPSGQCVTPSGVITRPKCGPGQVLSASGVCVPQRGSTFGPTTPKPCPLGKVPSASGLGCEYPRGPATPTSTSSPIYCPPGQVPSVTGSGCEYPRDQTTFTPKPSPGITPKQCPQGQVLTPSGCERSGIPGPTTYRPGISTGYKYPRPTQPFQEPVKPTPPTRCGPGQTLSASGICVYPSGTPACAPGQTRSPSGECVDKAITTYKPSFGTSTVKPSCPPGQVSSITGVGCEYPIGPTTCKPGQVLSPSGECVDKTITTYKPSYSTSATKPSCPPGQVPSASGLGCEYPRGPTSCKPGQNLAPSGECIDRPVSTYKPSSGPSTTRPLAACKPGQILSLSGICIDQTISTYKPSFGPTCPPGQVPSASGLGCEYPQGPSQRPSPCPPGQILSSSGSCIPASQKPCPPGQTRSSSGICVQTTLHPHTVNHFTTTSPKVRPTGGYSYPTPTPPFGYPSSTPLDTSQNKINNQYASTTHVPRYRPQRPGEGPSENPDNTVDSANANSFFVPTTRHPVTGTQPSYNRQPTFTGGQQPIEEASPPVGCAAALQCVQEIYCTADGFVSPVPVVLTKEQELLRVPTTTCKDIETGIIGKCCRDPNYKDPWPSANLVNGVDDGQYKEDNFYGQRELVSNNRLTRASNLTGGPGVPPALRRSRIEEARSSGAKCGHRNLDTSPKGESPLDANFAEYPWQAMILRDSNRSLLCGGVIIRDNAILTSAHCVEGLDTNDVLAKGGEWKLGIDEEPLPFQIVKVGAIIRHPEYKPGSYHNDVAILVLREKLRFTTNIGPLCLSQTTEISPNSKCKLTGWGKRILQLHARGAIMHHIDVNVMDSQKCQEQLSDTFKESLPNYSPNMICGQSNIDQCKVTTNSQESTLGTRAVSKKDKSLVLSDLTLTGSRQLSGNQLRN